jgi:hypothetical protein
MRRLLPIVLAAAVLCVTPTASAENSWDYPDRSDSVKGAIDVESTTLDTHTKGAYRVRIYGREFVKNSTDAAVLYFDAVASNTGPEYRLYAQFGKYPGNPHPGFKSLYKVDTWEQLGRRVPCAALRISANYSADVLTFKVPKACMKRPSEVRWQGWVGRITRDNGSTVSGYFDDFPKVHVFPDFWAG